MEEELELYKLIKSDTAIISNNIITNLRKIEQIGGEKLVYQKYYVTQLSFSLFGYKKSIFISKQKAGKIIFIRPLKDYWDKRSNRVSPNMWGKPKSKLTQFWCKLSEDYTNIKGDYISKNIQRVRVYSNQRVFNILRRYPRKFTIEIGIL